MNRYTVNNETSVSLSVLWGCAELNVVPRELIFCVSSSPAFTAFNWPVTIVYLWGDLDARLLERSFV